jgi:lysophospholipase L1-like esterase
VDAVIALSVIAVAKCRRHASGNVGGHMLRPDHHGRTERGGRRRWTRRALGALASTAIVTSAIVGVAPASPTDAATLAASINLWTQGPLGPVTILGDSVLMGSALTSPTLPDHLVANGWGPIKLQAIAGMTSGRFNVPSGARATYWVETWRAQGWDAPTVVVNIGANDSGFCGASAQCARESVMTVVDTIGPGRQVWWPQATGEPRHAWRVAIWNNTLAQLAAEIPNLHTWNWPTVMATEGYRSSDGVHLDPAGYRQRSARMAQQLTADVGRANRTGGDEPLPTATATPAAYVPLAPQRVIDTRVDPPGRRPAHSTTRVDLGDRLPLGATAVAVNVTAADPASGGHLIAHPCGSAHSGSTVNFTSRRARGAMTVTPIGPDGDLCVYAYAATDFVVDLQGAFVPPDGPTAGLGFDPYPAPERLLDTRITGRSKMLVIPTPPTAEAVAVTLTAVGASSHGWVRAFPCDGDPTKVSNVNYGPGEAVAGGAFVPTSAANTICLHTYSPVDVVVDITGTFSRGAPLWFVPSVVTRMLDTRNSTGGWSPIHGARQTVDVRVVPADAMAVTGTLTMINPFLGGYLTAHGCGIRPPTSSVNAPPGLVLASAVTTGVSDSGRLCVYASGTTSTIFDTTGWWVPRDGSA